MSGRPDRRRSLRLQGYDYAQAGAYFVTLCTQDRICLFGEIVDEQMRLNDAGKMVLASWDALPDRFRGIDLDEFVVMPNHIHGIIVLTDSTAVGAGLVPARDGPIDAGRATTRGAPTVGEVVGAFKSITTVLYIRGVNQSGWPPFRGRVWQRNYYEHVIRDEASLHGIREYIVNNPLQWALDRENPANVRAGNQATTRVAPTVSIDDARETVGAGLVPARDGSIDAGRATTRVAPTSWGDV